MKDIDRYKCSCSYKGRCVGREAGWEGDRQRQRDKDRERQREKSSKEGIFSSIHLRNVCRKKIDKKNEGADKGPGEQ